MDSYSYDPTRGWTQNMSWEGPKKRALQYARKLVRDWKGYGVDISVNVTDDVGGAARLDATLPMNIDPVDTLQWSLEGNDLEKAIETHPMLAAARDEEIELIRRVKANPQYLIQNWQEEMTAAGKSTGVTPNTYKILALVKRGVEVYSISQWTLKASKCFSSYNNAKMSVDNVGRQFTLSQLSYFEGLPTNLKFALPSEGWWIKRTPRVSTQGIRVSVEVEFWHVDAASIYLYPYVGGTDWTAGSNFGGNNAGITGWVNWASSP